MLFRSSKVDNTSDNEKSVLSASKLSNARKIGNASFDGTKDITLKETGALDPIGDEFNSSTTYAVGDFCIYNNVLYKCTTAINTAGEWDASKWEITTIANEIAIQNSNLNAIGDCEFSAKVTSNGNIKVPNLNDYRYIAIGYAHTDDIVINLSTIPISLFKTGKYFYVSAKYANVYDAQAHIKYVDDTTINVGLYGSGCFIYLVK